MGNKKSIKVAEKNEFPEVQEALKSMSVVGLDSDEKIWKHVDEWFQKLDENKDGLLQFEEIKPYLTQLLREEYGIEPRKKRVEKTFNDMGSGNADGKTRQELYEYIKAVSLRQEDSDD